MIKVGFLSLAHMHAASYGRALHKRDDVELIGVYDPDRKRGGEKGAEQMGTAYFARAEELLGHVDAAIICSETACTANSRNWPRSMACMSCAKTHCYHTGRCPGHDRLL